MNRHGRTPADEGFEAARAENRARKARSLPIDVTTVAGRADISVHEIAQEAARNRDALIHKARSLARSLNESADRLSNDPGYFPLSHGIVQTEGVEIDRLCALLDLQREALKRMVWVVRGEETRA